MVGNVGKVENIGNVGWVGNVGRIGDIGMVARNHKLTQWLLNSSCVKLIEDRAIGILL